MQTNNVIGSMIREMHSNYNACDKHSCAMRIITLFIGIRVVQCAIGDTIISISIGVKLLMISIVTFKE